MPKHAKMKDAGLSPEGCVAERHQHSVRDADQLRPLFGQRSADLPARLRGRQNYGKWDFSVAVEVFAAWIVQNWVKTGGKKAKIWRNITK